MEEKDKKMEEKEYWQQMRVLDMIYDMQRDALAYMVSGSTKGLEEGIKKIKVLDELRERGILPYKK
jgi:hypothetical protein